MKNKEELINQWRIKKDQTLEMLGKVLENLEKIEADYNHANRVFENLVFEKTGVKRKIHISKTTNEIIEE